MALKAPPGSGRAGLRDRKKSATRTELQVQALRLFTHKGFASTSVDEIAAAAEVSRSTFFRYFGSKEAVLFAPIDERGEMFVRFLRERPRDEGPVTAYENATLDLAAAVGTDSYRDSARMYQELLRGDAGLRERNLALLQRWQDAIAETFAARREEGGSVHPEDRLAASICISMSQHIGHEWREGEGVELEDTIKTSFQLLRAIIR